MPVMKHTLRLRVMALKEDNPWLEEDVEVRPGLCIKVSGDTKLSEVTHDPALPELDAKSAARALVYRLHRDGLL